MFEYSIQEKYKRIRRNRLITISVSIAVVLLVLVFIAIQFRQQMVFFYSPSQITDNIKRDAERRPVRVGGMVVKGSIQNKVENDKLVTEFNIADYSSDLHVVYIGILPKLFKEGQGVVAVGKFSGDNFSSTQMLFKHDESYKPMHEKEKKRVLGQNL